MADAKELLKTAGGDIRAAESRMFSRQFAEAGQLAARAEEALGQVLQLEPQNPTALGHLAKLNKLKKDLAAKGAPASAPASAPAQAPATAAPALPAGVAKRLRDIQAALKRRDLESAGQFMKEIESSYAGQFDPAHPQFREAAAALQASQASRQEAQGREREEKSSREEARKEREAQCGEWEKRLRALPPFAFQSADVSGLLAQRQAHDRARTLLDELRAASFPAGKTEGLENLERELERQVTGFPGLFAASRAALVNEARSHLQGRLEALSRETEGKPSILGASSLQECRQTVAAVAPLLEGDPAGDELNALVRRIEQTDRSNRLARARLIIPGQDLYGGPEADGLKAWASDLVKRARPAPQVVRAAITKPEWQEISRWEGQGDERRFVTRREIYAQVAARVEKSPRLFFVYLTQERRQDGSWSGLDGNVMYTEEMIEENL